MTSSTQPTSHDRDATPPDDGGRERDDAIVQEIAYRMQSRWPGGEDIASAVRTAASLGRAEGRVDVVTWLNQKAAEGIITEDVVFEAVIRFGSPL